MYDYLEAVKEDVMEYVKNEVDTDGIDFDELETRLYDDLFIEDSVTGNASGSYTFSSIKAQGYVEDNKNLVREMCSEFGNEEQVMNWWYEDDYESIDVSLRCYVLGNAIAEVIKELKEAAE